MLEPDSNPAGSMGEDERIQRAAVIAEALTWLHTPFHHQARVKGAGVDCTMLVAEVYERAGILPHQEFRNYPRDWFLHKKEEAALELLFLLCPEVSTPQPGDVAMWKIGNAYSHAAIVTAWPKIIHAYVPAGEVVEDNALTNQRLAKYPVRFGSPWRMGTDSAKASTSGGAQSLDGEPLFTLNPENPDPMILVLLEGEEGQPGNLVSMPRSFWEAGSAACGKRQPSGAWETIANEFRAAVEEFSNWLNICHLAPEMVADGRALVDGAFATAFRLADCYDFASASERAALEADAQALLTEFRCAVDHLKGMG